MAKDSIDREFVQVADAYRDELLAHCYRMLGAVRDAEIAVREAYQRASRNYQRQSPRPWLYGLATEACLAALGNDSRRPLPSALVDPSNDPEGELSERREVLWLEPIPDALVPGQTNLGLDLITGLQHLPPGQRALVALRDIAGFPEPEAMRIVGSSAYDGSISTYGVDSGPATHRDPELLARYAAAFERYDVAAIVAEFAADAVWEMPPFTSWFRGPRNIGRLITKHCPAKGPGDQVLVPVEANGQPGFAVYMRESGSHRAFQIQVLTLTAAGVVHAVAFFDVSLFASFNLPELLTGLSDSPTGRPPQPTRRKR